MLFTGSILKVEVAEKGRHVQYLDTTSEASAH